MAEKKYVKYSFIYILINVDEVKDKLLEEDIEFETFVSQNGSSVADLWIDLTNKDIDELDTICKIFGITLDDIADIDYIGGVE